MTPFRWAVSLPTARSVASLDEDDEEDQKLIAELKDEIASKEKEKELREEQERISEWLEDAEHKEERAGGMRSLIDRVGANVRDFAEMDKKRILELLQVRVDIVGDSKSGQKGGSKDPMLEWRRENQIPIPIGVSHERWARIEGILAGGRNPKPDDRGCCDMLLEKLRNDAGWHDYDRDERIGGKGWAVFYRLGRRWFMDGMYAAALEALGPYQGVPAPDGYTLPPMKIYGVIDDSVEDEVKTEAGGRITSTKGIRANDTGRAAA
ncbi:hypothetical protein ACWGBX_36030 [Streptomyces sp. NPDC055037]